MRTYQTVFVLVVMCGAIGSFHDSASAQSAPSKEQLAKWLEEYPAADTNKDGVLTRVEADAYRKKREEKRFENRTLDFDFRTEFTFATMPDGVKIALAIGYPRDFAPNDPARKWPAMMEMHGYPGSTEPKSPSSFGDHYVTVRASLRGAGASGGTIHAISRRNGLDGYEVIENWIVKQPWSNGKVALHGHSWGGLTGLMIAATNPPHLSAVAVSGLFDDVYRDIGRIGGIRNSGFPVDWMVNLYKPTGPFDSGEAARQMRGLSRDDYRRIVAARPAWDLANGILWKSLKSAEHQPAFDAASPGKFAHGVRAPIHLMHAYQDEQTGPSGAWIWKLIPDDVPKRLVLTNGDHGDVGRFGRERRRWLDFWTLHDGQDQDAADDFTDRNRRVQVYFETPRGSARLNEPVVGADFPLPQTDWKRIYLRDGGRLSLEPSPTHGEEGDKYRVAVGRPDGERDEVHYLFDIDEPIAICGPIAVTLWATCTTVDTDFFVVIADVGPDGVVQYLQRGLLRGSHRGVDEKNSEWVTVDGSRQLIRPRHFHQNPEPLVPGKPYRFEIEVFPLGHLFRPGHQLAVGIGQPPLADLVAPHSVNEPSYKYQSAQPPSTVTILRSSQYPSSILFPVLRELPVVPPSPPRPGEQAGIFVN